MEHPEDQHAACFAPDPNNYVPFGNGVALKDEVKPRLLKAECIERGVVLSEKEGNEFLRTFHVDNKMLLERATTFVRQRAEFKLVDIFGSPDRPEPVDVAVAEMKLLPVGTRFIVFLSHVDSKSEAGAEEEKEYLQPPIGNHYVYAINEPSNHTNDTKVIFKDFQPFHNHAGGIIARTSAPVISVNKPTKHPQNNQAFTHMHWIGFLPNEEETSASSRL